MNEIKIEWKPVKEYSDRYLISNTGDVLSLKTNKILKQELRRGYLSVQLFNGKRYKHYSIHRLIADHFIDNPYNYLYVNHKDENKLNNNVNNLEWCTAAYNVNYGTAKERAREKKIIGVSMFLKDGTFIRDFDSIITAQRIMHIPNPNIVKCCKGKRKTAGGYIWRYINS